MGNLVIQNNDLGSVIFGEAQHRDELLTFIGAGTVAEGTILARKAVDNAIVATANGGNTGNGAVTAQVVGGIDVPQVGNYVLTCTATVANGGVFQIKAPDGSISGGLALLGGSGATTLLVYQGVEFSVTDGGTDFVAGDFFTGVLVANGKMVPFAIAGLGGEQVPTAIATNDIVAAGAGDEATRIMISGRIRKERLIIDLDGNGSNITDAILDQLRDADLVPVDVEELNQLDNQ